MNLLGQDLISIQDLTRAEVDELCALARELRDRPRPQLLAGRMLVNCFLDPSLRTRASMEAAMASLGGRTITITPGRDAWTLEWRKGAVMDGDAAEHVKEAAKVLSRYGDALGVRSFARGLSLEEDATDPVISAFREHAEVPLLNLESALAHPLQALADIMTMQDALGGTDGKKAVLCWAYHPKPLPLAVPNSFALAATKMGMNLTICRPEGYDLDDAVVAAARANAAASGAVVEVTHDKSAAFAGAAVVYAKSWRSLEFYGKPKQERLYRRSGGLESWQVTPELMALTPAARFMHCLPVRRNVVAADAVIDAETSLVYEQAGNRLHTARAVLAAVLAGGAGGA